jgi:hypothetical protein
MKMEFLRESLKFSTLQRDDLSQPFGTFKGGVLNFFWNHLDVASQLPKSNFRPPMEGV